MLEGGCLCGAIRYRIRVAPTDVVHCHCSMCRRASGAPAVTWATVASADFAIVKGAPKRYVSSARASRQFCAECGAQLTFQYNDRPDEIDVTVATLDDPAAVPPRQHVWAEDRIAWLTLDPELPARKPAAG